MKKFIKIFIIFLIIISFTIAEEAELFDFTETISTSDAVEEPAPTQPAVEEKEISRKFSFDDLNLFYEIYVKSARYSTNFEVDDYNQLITRADGVRLGFHVPLLDGKLILDPYVGGQYYFGGDKEAENNFFAPALGCRTKFLKNFIAEDSPLFVDFFREVEFFVEKRSVSILEDSGREYEGEDEDFLFGFKNYKEYWQKNTWQQFFTSLIHYDSAWQNPLYFQESDFLLYANIRAGYNLNKNDIAAKNVWNFGPYYRFEMFKTFSEDTELAYWYNKVVNHLGFHFRYTFDRQGWHTTWVDFFLEYGIASYFDYTPDSGTPDECILLGVEFWHQ